MLKKNYANRINIMEKIQDLRDRISTIEGRLKGKRGFLDPISLLIIIILIIILIIMWLRQQGYIP